MIIRVELTTAGGLIDRPRLMSFLPERFMWWQISKADVATDKNHFQKTEIWLRFLQPFPLNNILKRVMLYMDQVQTSPTWTVQRSIVVVVEQVTGLSNIVYITASNIQHKRISPGQHLRQSWVSCTLLWRWNQSGAISSFLPFPLGRTGEEKQHSGDSCVLVLFLDEKCNSILLWFTLTNHSKGNSINFDLLSKRLVQFVVN